MSNPMAKRKSDVAGERMLTLESALMWAMRGSGLHILTEITRNGTVRVFCRSCKEVARFDSGYTWHLGSCPYRRAMELLNGLRPRKWETK